MKRIRDEFLYKLEKVLPLKDKTVLEVGCGDGRLSAEIARRCKRLAGVDPNRDLIDVARSRNIPNAQFYKRRAEDLPFVYPQFDVAIFTLSLHHIPIDVMKDAIDSVVRVTAATGPKDAGHIVFLEPGTKGSFFNAEIWFDACDGDERKAKTRADRAMLSHPNLELLHRLKDETAFRFSSVEDFRLSMTPKQNLGDVARFLRRHRRILRAERIITVCRVKRHAHENPPRL
ncbi:hypothetical protein A3F55_00120 [Candidatus Adlerbacteria bacterium RIFCSPHIGHO2_12_FULL_53_18]|uniref:Methyltransferase domain-containing protein n=1 Tax=Candidatus Adlerbacteria bacterium RIFCSPHIGHO2_12_FULL_53_18 TaxID=1797242 RepID=A0A1F4XT63_9BACT|nr:MAG: hypothetical protein A3F55_00120 [Candidatus Adlerbacteria bacterium RIFCSPHIGHO2_12_FULL_53_18]